MKVLYSGGTICGLQTLRRLVLIADEIGFMDRPSVTFHDWGTIGRSSEFRRFNTKDAPITFTVHESPSGPANELYGAYISADLKNPAFIGTFLEGLANDEIFRTRFIQLKANYATGLTGQQVLNALLVDRTLASADLTSPVNGKLMFQVDNEEARRETLKVLLVEASIHITNAVVISEASGLVPVSDDPYFCRLISMRAGDSRYVGQHPTLSPYLGYAIASSVIPEEALSKLKIQDIFEYRRSAKDAYTAWNAEIDRLAARITDIEPDKVEKEIPRIINEEIQPKLIEYRNEMKSARDVLFGDLIKRVVSWEMPTLSVAYLASLDLTSALAAFAGALAPAVPAVVDYFVKRRDVHRRNSMAYLIGLSKRTNE